MPGYKVIQLDQKPSKATVGSLEQVALTKNLDGVTDEEIIERLRERFDILDDMTRAVKKGDVRAMIVSGPPGVGKSFGVEKVLGKYDLLPNVAQNDKLRKYEIVKGAITALGLYAKLYEFADTKSILVFDDVDVIFTDELALNLLKAALDSSKKRTINWNADSRLLRQEGIPNSFEFKGGCIFITNLKFSHVKSKKLQEHLMALESRCHYLDLTIDTEREKMLRIRQIVGDGMLDDYNFTEDEVAEIIQFIDEHKKQMRELSLRTVLKTADLKKAMPHRWQKVAKLTIMKHS